MTNLICGIMLLFAANTNTAAAESTAVAGSDSLITDSIGRAPSDSHCSVELAVDFPTAGPQQLVDSVRSYIAEELKSFYMARVDGDGEPRPANYTGDINDGKALVNFHAEHLLADMQDSYKALEKDMGVKEMYMTSQSSIRVESQNDSIVAMEARCYQYEGGAHGLYWMEGTTFRKSDGTRITIDLDQFLVEQMQPLLRDGLAKYLSDNGSTMTVDELLNNEIFMADHMIPLPATPPYLTANGVKFVYQEYEIGPYALGSPTFTIPFEKIKPFLVKDEEDAPVE